MPKPIGKREAFRQALRNAAGIIEAEDLESLFADLSEEYDDDESWERLTEAQARVVRMLRKAAGDESKTTGKADAFSAFVQGVGGKK